MTMHTLRTTCLVAILAMGGSAIAQSTDDVTEAESHFAAGQAYAAKNEMAQAIAEYEEAYRRNPDPKYLFQLGEANRAAGNPERARFYYRSYVQNVPDAPNRAEVDADIAAVEQQIAARKAAANAPPPPPKPVVTPAPAAAVVETAPAPPPKKSKAWIAGIVIPAILLAGGAVALGVLLSDGGGVQATTLPPIRGAQ